MQIGLKDGMNVELESTTILPYEISPDKKLLFYAVRKNDGVLYRLKDLKTQQDENLFVRPKNVRILRAFWLDNSRLILLSADHVVSLWSIKENKTLALITGCLDFALRPHSEVAAETEAVRIDESLVGCSISRTITRYVRRGDFR